MKKLEEFKNKILSTNSYIGMSYQFIEEFLKDNSDEENVLDYLRLILIHNSNMNELQKERINHLKSLINNSKEIKISEILPETTSKEESVQQVETQISVTDLIEYVVYCNREKELPEFLKKYWNTPILKRIKITLLKQIIELKQKIKTTLLHDITDNVKDLQDELSLREEALTYLKQYVIQKDYQKDSEIVNDRTIVFLPHNDTTYFYEDISDLFNRFKEINLIFNKIITGYFLETKDTRAIIDKKINLYEYKTPNGFRILYVVKDSLIIICSLFIKDKQKSSKIDLRYDEAKNRFTSGIDYILENIENPDFYIEQAELIGQITSLLEEPIILEKKVGDPNA